MFDDCHEGWITSSEPERGGSCLRMRSCSTGPVIRARWVALAVALSLAGVPASAATGFTYRLVRDFPAAGFNGVTAPDEALCNFAFNDLGHAAYTASRVDYTTTPQVVVTSLYFWDGTSETLLFRDVDPRDGLHFPTFSSCPGYGIGLNNSGLIALPAITSPASVPGMMYFRPGIGHIGTVEDPARSSAFWSRANLNDTGQVAYVGGVSPAVGVSCFRIGTIGLGIPTPTESRICNTDGEYLFVPGFGGGIVNGSGQAAFLVSRQGAGAGYSTSLLDYDPSGMGRLTDLGLADEWFVHSAVPGFNASGFASVVTDGPQPLNHPGSVFRVALVSPDRRSVSILADGSVFTRDPRTGRSGSWLNDRNQVAFVVQDLDATNPGNARQGLWLVDPAKEPLLVLLGGYEPFEFGGQVARAVYLWTDSYPGGRGDLIVNNGGDVMFSATYVPAGAPTSTLRHGIFVASPEPGLTPANPVLPGPGDALPLGWRFVAPCAAIRNASFYPPGSATPPPRTCWVDPAFASGYTFTAEPGSANFASVVIPAPLPGGDAEFTLEVDGLAFPLQAGQVFDLTSVNQAGVPSFRIAGIDLAEALSPTDPAAFVTGLTWIGDPTAPNNFTLVPIVDSDGDGVEDAVDACPGTAPGAPVDATGCAPAQRDSDGDGVTDDIDQCAGTPAGTPVNAVGCPLPPPDSDGDGIPDLADVCPGTAPGAPVDATGCSPAQRDSDGDGVTDDIDQCAGTPAGTPVNAVGCPLPPPDSDGDGIPDSADTCSGTAPGAAVDANGCSAAQRDSDGDGVTEDIDQCAGTPAGTPVNAVGCPLPPPDSDGDGVPDSADRCPATSAGAAVDSNGCSASQRDSDGDGVMDDADACAGTPTGTPVNAVGCPIVSSGRVCDVDRDGDVDWRDIKAVAKAVGQQASGPTDPRDANRSGRIDVKDVLICSSKCDRWLCASP